MQSLALLGFSQYESAVLLAVRPGAIPAFQAFRLKSAQLVREYAQECGRHVLYIQFLATEGPVQEQQGLTARLLHHLEATADAQGKDLYVEVTRQEREGMFAKHGFQPWKEYVVGEEEAEGGGGGKAARPNVLIMVRPASASKGGEEAKKSGSAEKPED